MARSVVGGADLEPRPEFIPTIARGRVKIPCNFIIQQRARFFAFAVGIRTSLSSDARQRIDGEPAVFRASTVTSVARRNTEESYLIARIKTVRCVQLALGLAAAIRERGRSGERLLVKFEFSADLHRVAVGFPLAAEMRRDPVSELEARVALRRAGKALVNMTVVRRLEQSGDTPVRIKR